ncbi:hypothetical protein BDV59DRAFT_175408 [Aspergillus ambiguus]|uniref:uncharacterized protein n=1 Tax=Aspergillus ambiguus TaxID=176160 RepID=UPI003CCE2EFE
MKTEYSGKSDPSHPVQMSFSRRMLEKGALVIVAGYVSLNLSNLILGKVPRGACDEHCVLRYLLISSMIWLSQSLYDRYREV